MSPIDDELRTALQRRATVVAPSPDPLAGIERRAVRMRRNRVAASVAGSVLAVAAVATAVPLLTGSSAPDAPPVAVTRPTAEPTAEPSPVVPTTSYALDPAAPWAYRGTPLAELGQGFVETATREYATRRGVAEDAVTLTPLWGQVDEPSGQAELVFVATVDGQQRWGVARGGEAGPELLVDEPLPDPALALAAALPGDEVPRVVVVTAPEARPAEYFPDETVEDATPLAELADGVSTGPLEGDPAADSLLVREADGRELWRGPAPDVAGRAPTGGQAEPPAEGTGAPPSNVVDWPLRGSVPEEQEDAAKVAAARSTGVSPEQVSWRPLFGAERDGTFYGVAQVWSGGDAQVFAWASDPDDPGRRLAAGLQSPTAPGPAVIAELFHDVLVVVPEPRTGQVLYAPNATGEPVAVPDQGTEAAVLVERAPGASGDRLLVLDGDGDPERPVYRGTVDELLAASSS